jgi:large subunit ribosomal protein L16
LSFGQYGIKALANGYFPAKTLEAMRQTLNRKLKKTGKLWVRVFPDIPRSQKPAEVRMGKGKGGVSFWTSQIAAGQVLFEINTSSPELALQATKTISRMASLPVGLIKKEQPQ